MAQACLGWDAKCDEVTVVNFQKLDLAYASGRRSAMLRTRQSLNKRMSSLYRRYRHSTTQLPNRAVAAG